MFSLKSGCAISTHNACLCPLMLLALILIGAVLLSTSSLASNTHTHTRWESCFFLLQSLFFWAGFLFLQQSSVEILAHAHTVGCHFLSSTLLNSKFPVCEPFSQFMGGVRAVAKPTHPVGKTIKQPFLLLQLYHNMMACMFNCDLNSQTAPTKQLYNSACNVYLFDKVSKMPDLSQCCALL